MDAGAEELDWDEVYADQPPRVFNYFRFRLGREADERAAADEPDNGGVPIEKIVNSVSHVNHKFQIQNVPAAFLVPILRPLLPQYAHLAAVSCSNTLLMVDRYANVKRVEAIIKTLDIGTPYEPEQCEPAKRNHS